MRNHLVPALALFIVLGAAAIATSAPGPIIVPDTLSNGGTVTGDLTMSGGDVNFQKGSVGAPSLRFASDSDTGVYLSATGHISLATAGTERFRVEDSVNSLYIYIGGSLRQVTYGATDSGGSGYRYLRVPN